MKPIPDQEYWLSNPELTQLLFTESQVTDLESSNILHDPNLFDLSFREYTHAEIKPLIEAYDIDRITRYYDAHGHHLTQEFANDIITLIDLAKLSTSTNLKFGISISRCDLRSFPTTQEALSEDLDEEIDRFQESALYPFEPVLVLHISLDKNWYFVQTYNYNAWVHITNIQLISKDDFLYCFHPNEFTYIIKDFLTVYINCNDQAYEIQMPMGSRIPNYLIKNMIAGFTVKCNHADDKISTSPMAFTRYNILKLALQCLGDPYDWGGKAGYRDCSSLIADVFRCLGLNLPRNANQQVNYAFGVKCDCSGSKDVVLSSIKPGSLIFISGHVMIYLGAIDNEHYVIHSVKEFYYMENNNLEKSSVAGVQITPLSIYRKNWESYRSSINAICSF